MRYILPIVLLVLIWSIYALLPTLYYKFIKKPVFPNKVQQTKLAANRQHRLLNPSPRDSKEAESRSIQILNQEKFDLEAIDFKIDQKTIYLTFDDGPDKEYTQQILQLLAKNHVKAVFFVVSQKAVEHPQVIDDIIRQGHSIGFHCQDHSNPMLWTSSKTRRDFEQGLGQLKTLGIQPQYYRPPHGYVNLQMLRLIKKHNLQLCLWNILPGDWKLSTTPKQLLGKMEQIQEGNILCLHDSGEGTGGEQGATKNTLAALEQWIPYMKTQGFEFGI